MHLLRRLVRYGVLATVAQGCFIPVKHSDTVDGSRTEYVPATSTCPSEDEVQRKWKSHLDDLSLDATRSLGGRSRVCWYRLSLSAAQNAQIADDCADRTTDFASMRTSYLATQATAGRVSPSGSLTAPEPQYMACAEGGAVAALVVGPEDSCLTPGARLTAPRFVFADPQVAVAAVLATDELPDVLACEYSYEYEQSRPGCGSVGFAPR